MALRLKRGSTADRNQLYFEEGELVYDVDLEQVFVGNGLQSEGGQIGGVAVGSGAGGSVAGITSTATVEVLTLTDVQSTFKNDVFLDTGTVLTGFGDIDIDGSIATDSTITATVSVTSPNIISTADITGVDMVASGEIVGDTIVGNTSITSNGDLFTDTISPVTSGVKVTAEFDVETSTSVPIVNLHRNDATANFGTGLNGIIIFKTTDLFGAKNVTTIGNAGGTGTVISQHDGSGNFPDSHKLTISESGNFGLGTTTPGIKLDVVGDANISGTLTAASFNGTLVADDSTVLVDGVKGEIPYGVLGAGTASTGDVLKFDGVSWIASADLQGSGGGAATISGATQANPVVVTTDAAHGFGDGQKVTITDVVGMTELNGNSYFVDTLTIDTFALYSDAGLTSTVDGTAYTAYASGGSAAPAPASDAVTLDGQFPSYYLDYNNFTNTPTLAAVATSGAYGDLTGTPTLFDGAFSSLTGTPTTVAGYGITDAITTADVGAFTFSGSIIDTSDSSTITITPDVLMSSDLTVENNLNVTNKITAETLEVTNLITAGAGTPELESETDILLTAGTRVEVTQSPLKFANLTNAQRDALTAENGDMIYNTDDNRFQAYQNGAWVRIDFSAIV